MLFTTEMIKPLIEKIGWTQKDLAEAVGASEQQMIRWIKGRSSKKMLLRHRKAFIAVCVSNCIDAGDLK